LVSPQTEHTAVLVASLILVSLWSIRVIHRARDCEQVATVGAGTVEVPPSNVIIFKGCHNVEHSAATGTGVDRA
jgi:hypothetical protein